LNWVCSVVENFFWIHLRCILNFLKSVNPKFERNFDVQNSYFGGGYVFRISFLDLSHICLEGFAYLNFGATIEKFKFPMEIWFYGWKRVEETNSLTKLMSDKIGRRFSYILSFFLQIFEMVFWNLNNPFHDKKVLKIGLYLSQNNLKLISKEYWIFLIFFRGDRRKGGGNFSKI